MKRVQECDGSRAVKAMKLSDDIEVGDGFSICLDVNELIPNKREAQCYDNTNVFLITRLRYQHGNLYLFLTGHNNVQFYFCSPCTIYSYKMCFHTRVPCKNKCKPYKSMVVTGLKERECHRINVYKVSRANIDTREHVLDEFCTDENRVQMQLGVYEGDYIRFVDGVNVNEEGCARGNLSSIKRVSLEELTKPIDVIVGSYDIETYTNLRSFSSAKIDPIITISYVYRNHDTTRRYCFINTNGRKFGLAEQVNARAEYVDGEIVVLPYHNERDMIVSFFRLLCATNPDDVLDYNGDKFDLPYLLERASILNIDLALIQRYDLPCVEFNTLRVNTKFGYSFDNFFMTYYNHLDLYQYVKGSVDANRLENLKLDTVAGYYLNVGKVELSVKEMMQLYNRGEFAKIVRYNVRDSILPIEMFYKCQVSNKLYADSALLYLTRDDSTLTIWRRINLALFKRAMTNTSEDGTPDPYFFNKTDLSKIMHRKPSEGVDESDEEDKLGAKVDYTNLSRPRVPKHVMPDTSVELCQLTQRIKYTGGRVLSPAPGYYGVTFTVDFSQLYTSIMIHHTCCLSNLFFGDDNKLYLQHNKNAITTKFLNEMASKRAHYKKQMKFYKPDQFEYKMYDSWQNATKLVCNSQYGWFGLCCKALANFITAQGRSKLKEAQEFIESLSNNEDIKKKWGLSKMKLRVVYGDTDSNFVHIDVDEKIDLRAMIEEDILKPLNAIWKGAFKMELENIMQCMLLKGKKAYMCLKDNGQLYKRGFNVKKDSPLFLRKAFDNVLLQLLTDHSLDCVLKNLVDELKRKRDEFCVENCEEYSFSQTLNETKSGIGTSSVITIANMLVAELKDNPNTKYVPSSGDRIPYLLVDKYAKNVRDKVKPTQLFNETDNMNWSKHLGIVCTFLNDIMSMVGNDTLFVFAFDKICEYLQRDQVFDVVYPVLKVMTNARVKDILCKEMTIKNKKELTDSIFEQIIKNSENKFIHTHEFTMLKRPAPYTYAISEFSTDCPTCNGLGVSAVRKFKTIDLV
uniref:DNA-directed DNA polymerase n=1 Tax=Phthorimaea operculella granulovirus TaxID=192584 RepID=A0A481SFG5_9BBAC|nr:DNA polymerase [Phthorimaea operculella granulovirus]